MEIMKLKSEPPLPPIVTALPYCINSIAEIVPFFKMWEV